MRIFAPVLCNTFPYYHWFRASFSFFFIFRCSSPSSSWWFRNLSTFIELVSVVGVKSPSMYTVQHAVGKLFIEFRFNTKLNIQLNFRIGLRCRDVKCMETCIEVVCSQVNKVFADRFLIALSRIKWMKWNGMKSAQLHIVWTFAWDFVLVWRAPARKIVEISRTYNSCNQWQRKKLFSSLLIIEANAKLAKCYWIYFLLLLRFGSHHFPNG